MAKESVVIHEGRILDVLPGGQFRVLAEGDVVVLATVANRARRELRHLRAGEPVAFETSAYDLRRGRIVSRAEGQGV